MSTDGSTGEDRKSRLAALRKKRLAAENGNGNEVEIKSTEEVPLATNHEQPKELLEKESVEVQIEQQSDIVPSLQLTGDGGDTVEAIASRLQQEILHKAQQKATDLSFAVAPEEKSDTKIFTADLKKDIEINLNKAQFRTNRAINQLLQERYASELPN